MSEMESLDPEVAGAADASPPPRVKGRRSFSRMRRELTEEELADSAVQKMMMDELDRLDEENADLKSYVDKFHEADKIVATQIEKLKARTASDIMSGAMLTVGAAIVGYSKAAGTNGSVDYILLALGALLIAGGIAARVVLK